MIDALLYAVRDTIRNAGFSYGKAECELTGPDGTPPPRCGTVFVSVHGGKSRNNSDNNLDEKFGFSVTLTMRVTIPLDRIGDQLIARNIELVPQAQRQGFNAKVEQLRGLLHMNWPMTVMLNQNPPSANDNIQSWSTSSNPVYGFVEPARYQGEELPQLVGGEWFGTDPDTLAFGLKCEMKYDGARRIQPQTLPIGPFI